MPTSRNAIRSSRGRYPELIPGGQWRLRSGSPTRRPQVLVDAVDDTLIVQRGEQLGYTLTDDQFKAVLDNIEKTRQDTRTTPQFRLARPHAGPTT